MAYGGARMYVFITNTCEHHRTTEPNAVYHPLDATARLLLWPIELWTHTSVRNPRQVGVLSDDQYVCQTLGRRELYPDRGMGKGRGDKHT